MAIVPPGNKQVGEFAAVVTTSRPTTTYAQLLSGTSVLLNTLVGIVPTPVNNLMVGEFAGVVTSSRSTRVLSNLLTSTAVLKYAPPASAICQLLTATAALKGPVAASPVPPLNLLFGEFAGVVTSSRPTVVTAQLITATAVVQQFTRRLETLIMSLTYPTVK